MNNCVNHFIAAGSGSGRKGRPISISVCTSADKDDIGGLMNYFEHPKTDMSNFVIKDVKFLQLPYSNLDEFRFLKRMI